MVKQVQLLSGLHEWVGKAWGYPGNSSFGYGCCVTAVEFDLGTHTKDFQREVPGALALRLLLIWIERSQVRILVPRLFAG